MKNKNKSTGFIVYDFFAAELDLKPTEQLTLGIIYSFTRSGGDFTGSQGYIVKRINVSEKTVGTTLTTLVKKGYLIKAHNPRCPSVPLYRASPTVMAASENSTEDEKLPVVKGFLPHGKNLPTPSEVFTDNNKEITKEIINNNLIDNDSNARTRKEYPSGVFVNRENGADAEATERDPENDIIYLGREDIVHMTVRQHNTLYKLLGMEVLDNYIERVELYATEGMKHGCHVHSFYNTIRLWVKEDLGI